MDPDGAFWDSPFPSAHRVADDGTIPLDGFPVLEPTTPFVSKLLDLVDGTLTGFGTTSGVFFRLESSPTALPAFADTVADSPIFLIGLDGPDAGVRVPVTVDFQLDGGPYGAIRHLCLLPLQGRPLYPRSTYAAVVLRDLPTEEPLGVSPTLWALIHDEPTTLSADATALYRDAIATLEADHGVAATSLAGLAVFSTQDPTAELRTAATFLRDTAVPSPADPWELIDIYDDYCVFRSRLSMPVLQSGAPPFQGEGGAWDWTATGTPAVVATEEARVHVTVPRRQAPAGGFPTTVWIRTGGGADRAAIDRGVRDEDGAAEPGTGYAQDLAAVGWATVEVDGPHGGLRNVTASDEQFLMFNMTNPVAMRDNVRQSAVELALLPPLLSELSIDTSACPLGPATTTFSDTLALAGHSMGATIAPLVLAVAPEFDAVLLSGAGGSWIANVVHKESPLAVRPLADSIVGYTTLGRTLHEHDPLLTLLQWGGESADPPVYGRAAGALADAPVHALMVQGIVDTYILPPMANATSLAFGWELGGDALDATDPRLEDHASWAELAPLAESEPGPLGLPASGNLPSGHTGVVVQYLEDPIEDGHEVFFQLDAPKQQVRRFLDDLAAGLTPTVPPAP